MAEFLHAAFLVTVVGGLTSLPLGYAVAQLAINPPRWRKR
jgi:hypothetical protein